MAEEHLLRHVSALQKDEPKLDAAIKNLVSIVIAYSSTANKAAMVPAGTSTIFTSAEGVAVSPGASATNSTSKEIPENRDIKASMATYSPTEALECARVLVKAIKETEILSEPDWIAIHPQGEQQTALDRLEQLLRYRALSMLYQRVIQSIGKPAEGSISKLFGKQFIIVADRIAAIREKVLSLHSPQKVSLEKLTFFVDEFERSLSDSDSLVWTTDFKSALYARSLQRMNEATQRSTSVELSGTSDNNNDTIDNSNNQNNPSGFRDVVREIAEMVNP